MNSSPIPSSTSASPRAYGVEWEDKRILCTADVRGNISQLNQMARETNAQYIIHTGDFGFYSRDSLERISDRTLKHLVQYSPLIPPRDRAQLNKTPAEDVRRWIMNGPASYLSEFSEYLHGDKQLEVPVFTVWGACEDVAILERFRTGEYAIPNLHIIDEATTHLLEIGDVTIRLLGLGGAFVQRKLFDNGEGQDTIAGGSGTMWTTALQMGELVETAQQCYDESEVRILVSHASPGREGLLAKLALVLRADFTISGGLHFRYGISYNEFACQSDRDHYCLRLSSSEQSFLQLWKDIKEQVESHVDDRQTILLQNALAVVHHLPPFVGGSSEGPQSERDEQAFKNMWNFNLPDASFGWLVLNVNHGRISAETKSQGFDFSYRRRRIDRQASPAMTSPTHSTTQAYPPAADWSPSPYPDYPRQSQQYNGHDWREDDSHSSGPTRRQSGVYRNPNVVYVGGLVNGSVTEDDIRDCFGRDKVSAVRFPTDPATRLPKDHCYVDFVDTRSLDYALSLDGMVLKDNTMIIHRPPSSDHRNRGRNQRGRGYRSARTNNNDKN